MNKKQAIDYLKERKEFFIENHLNGRAQTIENILKSLKEIEEDNDIDFDYVETIGIHVNCSPNDMT